MKLNVSNMTKAIITASLMRSQITCGCTNLGQKLPTLDFPLAQCIQLRKKGSENLRLRQLTHHDSFLSAMWTRHLVEIATKCAPVLFDHFDVLLAHKNSRHDEYMHALRDHRRVCPCGAHELWTYPLVASRLHTRALAVQIILIVCLLEVRICHVSKKVLCPAGAQNFCVSERDSLSNPPLPPLPTHTCQHTCQDHRPRCRSARNLVGARKYAWGKRWSQRHRAGGHTFCP